MGEVKVMWPLVVMEWDKIYLNYIDLGNATMFRMCIFKTVSPRLGLFVAIEDRGAFFFSLHAPFHKDYIAEKLCLSGDSANIADFLNAQLLNNHPQQGYYHKKLLKNVEPYGKIGEEIKIKPWHPKVLCETDQGNK